MLSRILLVDDEQDFLDSLRRGLVLNGFTDIRAESDPRQAAATIQQGEPIDIALIDIAMPNLSGLELLDLIKSSSPTTECIMLTAADEAELAVDCMKRGAFDYQLKPLHLEELLVVVTRALERKNLLAIQRIGKQKGIASLVNPAAFAPILTNTESMLRIMREAELHAASDVPVLITGATGTGKELLAKAIHRASSRANRPFVAINMSALTESLFDAEFYGHTKGAFTGAGQDRKGYLETASGGTLFLDEIGSLPLELQGKLLRVLQEGEYFKLGNSKPQGVDIRFIAATNADLEALQDQGLFRKDLFYRLCGAWLDLPPLRARLDDLIILAEEFLRRHGSEHTAHAIEAPVWTQLRAYGYPGNVRELQSIICYAANLAGDGPISVHTLPSYMLTAAKKHLHAAVTPADTVMPLAVIEKEHILHVYKMMGGNKLQTGKVLGIGLNTLRRKLKSYSVD